METYVLHLTKECNCCCHYCYEKDKTSVYAWEEIEKVIERIIKHSTEKRFTVEFLGGEPLLNFEGLRKSVEKFESSKEVDIASYMITTNGTILNSGITNFLVQNPKIHWCASMDGTKYANQLRFFKTGENTHDVVLHNFKILKGFLGTQRVGIHMVTHPFNVALIHRSVAHLYEQGVRSIGMGTVESTIIIGKEYVNRFLREMDEVSKAIVSGAFSGLHIDILEGVKPRSDVRYYFKDSSSKTVLESYGRAKGDITSKSDYTVLSSSSNLGDLIQNLREEVYNRHQKRLKNR